MHRRSLYTELWAAALLMQVAAGWCSAAEEPEEAPAAATAAIGQESFLAEPIVIPMQEVPVRGPVTASYPNGMKFLSGQIAACDEVPREAVKVYPPFVWKRPMYGRVHFDAAAAVNPSAVIEPAGVTEFHFALDASDPPKEVPGNNGAPTRQTLVLDRLYFDANQDLDLTNDRVLKLIAGIRQPAASRPGQPVTLIFEDLVLPFDFGPNLGKRPVRLTPRSSTCTTLTIGHLIQFMPKASRRGTFDLAGQRYVAQIQQNDMIYGRYDRHNVYLDISPMFASNPSATVAWGPLGDWHRIGGRFCTIVASPMGDQLTIVPHQGDVGTIEFGGGSNTIRVDECTLKTATASLPAVRPRPGQPRYSPLPHTFEVPVGDYAVGSLEATCGRLRITCRPLPEERKIASGDVDPYPIKIRKDKPYQFDFQEKPSVMLLDPPASARGPAKSGVGPGSETTSIIFRRGEVALLQPVLVLPSLELVVYVNQIVVMGGRDKSAPATPPLASHSLVVKDPGGKTVAEGDLRAGRFAWRIPQDLALAGTSETYSATVTFQTHDLYGPVEATFPIVVSRE